MKYKKTFKKIDSIQFTINLGEELSYKNVYICQCDEFLNIVTNILHILEIKINAWL